MLRERMRRITSRQNAAVARFKAAAKGEDDLLLLDGAHLVGDALDAGVRLREAVVASDAADRAELRTIVARLDQARVDVSSATAAVMDALSPVKSASAIVALGERPAYKDDAILGRAMPLVLVVADVQDPGNLGAIVRVAEAAGATGCVVAGRSADPFGWKALRGSMGSALRLPIVRLDDAADAVARARSRGCRLVATIPRGGKSLFDVDLKQPTAILVGGEGAGLPQDLVDLADDRVTIPMQAPVESLNAAVAAALLAYEARRQRASNLQFTGSNLKK
jgi:TrmH family RNA methyltransferase